MDKPKELWFKDIVKPDLILGDSKGYLDRLSGCKNIKDRQYLGKRKLKGSQFSQEKRKPKPPNKLQTHITPESLVDDEKWLEERKKKFPRVNSKTESEQPKAPLEKQSQGPKVNNNTGRPSYPNHRSKSISLFDKLMSDTEE